MVQHFDRTPPHNFLDRLRCYVLIDGQRGRRCVSATVWRKLTAFRFFKNGIVVFIPCFFITLPYVSGRHSVGNQIFHNRKNAIRKDDRSTLADFCFQSGTNNNSIVHVYVFDLEQLQFTRHHAGIDHKKMYSRTLVAVVVYFPDPFLLFLIERDRFRRLVFRKGNK